MRNCNNCEIKSEHSHQISVEIPDLERRLDEKEIELLSAKTLLEKTIKYLDVEKSIFGWALREKIDKFLNPPEEIIQEDEIPF